MICPTMRFPRKTARRQLIVREDVHLILSYQRSAADRARAETSGIPYTIIRATQFLEFLGAIAGSSTDGNRVRLPPGPFQAKVDNERLSVDNVQSFG